MTTHTIDPSGRPRAPAGLSGYLSPQAARLALMGSLLVAGVLLQLFIPQLLRDFIDAAMAGSAVGTLRDMAFVFLGAAIGRQLLGATATYAGADVGWRITNSMRSDLARHVFGLDMDFHKSTTPGNLIERIDGDITALGNFFSQFSVRVFGGVLLLIGILILLWTVHPWIGLGLTFFTLVQLVVLQFTRRPGARATAEERDSSAELFGFVEERLGGIEDLRANGAGPHAMWRFNAVMRRFANTGVRAWMMRSIMWQSGYGLFVLVVVATIGTMIYMVERDMLTLGTGFMVFQYMLLIHGQIEIITQHMQDVQKAATGLGRVRQLMNVNSALPPAGTAPLAPGSLALAFDDVTFRYPARGDLPERTTLRGVTFSLHPGEVLGLLGRTGSGKTTITRLLFRFYDPTGGSVLLNGTDLRDLDETALRNAVGLVTQDVQLFQATVRDNLTFFARDDASDERLVGLLREVGLGQWFDSLENGLDSTINASGSNLSAGEAQLLALARVFLKDPGLVVLDEPSSRLDPDTELRLSRAVDRLLRGRTAIVIAHRLETVEKADTIMVLQDGAIVEHGPRELLAADAGSRYARLLRTARAGATLDDVLEGEDAETDQPRTAGEKNEGSGP